MRPREGYPPSFRAKKSSILLRMELFSYTSAFLPPARAALARRTEQDGNGALKDGYFQKHTGALRNGMRRYETAGVPTMSAA